MKVILDGTPLLGPRTGIGRYVAGLVEALPAAASRRCADVEFAVSTWTMRGGRIQDLPLGVTQVGRRVPARWLQNAWRHGWGPRVERLTGPVDVFHGTNFVAPPTRSARSVVTIHDLTYLERYSTVAASSLAFRDLVPAALDRGCQVVTPTRVIRDAVISTYGISTDRVTVTPLGVSPLWSRAEAASPSWLESHGVPPSFVLFVGSLDPRKNLSTLVKAHALARAHEPGVPDLVLAGPAGRESGLAGLPNVHLTGWLNDSELRSLVSACTILVLPSLEEGFGLPVIEALAAGRPVLTSDLPVFEEVGGPCAMRVAATHPEPLAEGMIAALAAPDDQATRDRRKAWAATFTWDRCADATLDVYLKEQS